MNMAAHVMSLHHINHCYQQSLCLPLLAPTADSDVEVYQIIPYMSVKWLWVGLPKVGSWQGVNPALSNPCICSYSECSDTYWAFFPIETGGHFPETSTTL